jgi:Flp pilus assembly protein CpaB
MSMRAFLVVLVLLVIIGGAAAFFVLTQLNGGGALSNLLPGNNGGNAQQPADNGDDGVGSEEPNQPAPTATPSTRYVAVAVAVVDLPVGQEITPDLVRLESRPDTNIAVQAGVTFESLDEVIGQVVRTQVSRGQEILRPMLALNSTDLSTLGSDLALYVDQGRIAVAFPIDRYSGAALAMRPGDLIDVLMSINLVEIDEETQTVLPNTWYRIDTVALEEGRTFFFPPETAGRLELIPLINVVANIAPGVGEQQIPRRITQLTIQQAEVLWVGSWYNPNDQSQEFMADAVIPQPVATPNEDGEAPPAPTPTKQRPEARPDIVILSLTAQDALALKWALETGIDIDLVLRSQGDSSVFFTTSVSLPQMVEQGGLLAPEPGTINLAQPVNLVPTPGVPLAPATPVP